MPPFNVQAMTLPGTDTSPPVVIGTSGEGLTVSFPDNPGGPVVSLPAPVVSTGGYSPPLELYFPDQSTTVGFPTPVTVDFPASGQTAVDLSGEHNFVTFPGGLITVTAIGPPGRPKTIKISSKDVTKFEVASQSMFSQ